MGDAQYRLNPEPPSGIIPEGCTFSPDEVGAMLANRVVQPHYAAWLVRQAIQAAHAREVERAVANERVRDVHTCHDQCTKTELCRMTRRAEAAEAACADAAVVIRHAQLHECGRWPGLLKALDKCAAKSAAIASGGEG